MDGSRFDDLARSFVVSGSRRHLLGGLAAGALGLVGARSAGAAICRDAGRTCREHADCCSKLCGPKDATGRRRCWCQSIADCPAPDQCHAATCVGGVCGETVLVGQGCSSGSACFTGETCQANGGCGGGTAVSCDDGNACTADSCDPVTGCVHIPLTGTPCDDGDPCTINDVCTDVGTCVGTPVTCDPGLTCCGGVCNGAANTPCSTGADCCSGLCGGAEGCCPICPSGCICGTTNDQGMVCFIAGGSGTPCFASTDCPAGEACFGGNCETTCPPVG